MKRVIVMSAALLAAACGVLEPDGLSPEELCREAIAASRADFDKKEQDEAIGFKRWFWVSAPYAGQRPQKAPIYVDKETGFLLMARDSSIGAWVSVAPRDTIRDGYDKWACEMDLKSGPRMHVHCPAPSQAAGVDPETAKKFAETCAVNRARKAWGKKVDRKGEITYLRCGLFEEHWQNAIWREYSDGGMVQIGISYEWPEAAGPKPKYETPEAGAAVLFNVLAQRGARPVPHKAIATQTLAQARRDWEDSGATCEGNDDRPVRAEDPPAVPPGATPPDRGGIDVPPGTTPGGSDDGGDR